MAALTARSVVKGMMVRPLGSPSAHKQVLGRGIHAGIITVYLIDGTRFDVPVSGQVDVLPASTGS